ncbi:MAG: hypothetical protein WBV90_00285, partial [Terrimicrobiaceae bacterium]
LKLAPLRKTVFILGIREPYEPRVAAGKFLDRCAIGGGRCGINSLLGSHDDSEYEKSQPKGA